MFQKAKNLLPVFFIAIMFAGLFFSRALLSIGCILFFLFQVFAYYKSYSFKNIKANFSYLGIGAITLLFALTYFASVDKSAWADRTIVKLPLLLFGFAFLTLRISNFWIFTLHQLFIFIVLGGTIYSAANFYLYYEQIMEQYQVARVMPTIMFNDHIRFSWCVCIAILLCMEVHSELPKKQFRIINSLIAIWLLVFLHLLGSKTGLLMAYVGIFIYLIYNFKKIKPIVKCSALTSFIIFPIIAYNLFPSFKQRLHYIKYDFELYSKGSYRSGLSDGARILSIKAGVDITKNNLLTGVGAGDIQAATNEWYLINTPQVKDYEKILPSNQFLMVSTAIGIIGLLIFIWSLLLPVKIGKRFLPFIIFYSTALLSFLFEIHLEGQNGVFIFGFFTLWFLYLANNKRVSNAAY